MQLFLKPYSFTVGMGTPPNAFAPRFYSFPLGYDVTVGEILDSINRTRG